MSVKQSIDFHIIDFPNILHVLHFCLVILIIPLIPSVVQGHKVNIFAYAEDGRIFTESYFNDGSPCKESMIEVFDPEENELLHGKTDKEGIFSFKIPKRTDLRIVLTASMGHKAEYRMSASDLPDILDQKIILPQKAEEPIHSKKEPSPFNPTEGPSSFMEVSTSSQEDLGKIEPSPLSPLSPATEEPTKIEPSPFNAFKGKPGEIADQNIRGNPSQPLIAFDLGQIRSVVEDAVDRSIEKRMKPLIHSMVRAQTSRLPLTDIIGGIGYIFGIMGLILYFKKRDK